MIRPLRVLLALALGCCLLGASCGSEGESSSTRSEPESSGSEGLPLPGVNLGRLTDEERRLFRRIVQTELSPCGDPVSLERCVSERRQCKACAPAVRYTQRLVTDGYGRDQIEERLRTRYSEDGKVPLPVGDAPVRGSAMAPITVVEFSDFECPACGAAHPIVKTVLERYPERVRLVMMQFPLSSHPHAGEAARASLAAGAQGRFWEMHDAMFEHQRALARPDLERYAAALSLDLPRFLADLESASIRERVDAQKELGRSAGVEGTPTFFVNGRKFLDGPGTLIDYLEEEIAALP